MIDWIIYCLKLSKSLNIGPFGGKVKKFSSQSKYRHTGIHEQILSTDPFGGKLLKCASRLKYEKKLSQINIMINSVDLLIYLLLGLIENYWVIENVIAVRFLVWMIYWMYFTESGARPWWQIMMMTNNDDDKQIW